jgi:hypothetical protein
VSLASSDKAAPVPPTQIMVVLIARLDIIVRIQVVEVVQFAPAESTKQMWDKLLVKIVRLANIRLKPRNLVAQIAHKINTVI